MLDSQIAARQAFLMNPVDGQVFIKLIEASLAWLRTNQQIVNALNVFPVPDGDTGTNMVLTLQAAHQEVARLDEHNIGAISHAISHGALMGARGNSGVILSQLLRGFARALDHNDSMAVPDLVSAFAMARDTAYKGVVRPVEGTILTVAKDIASATETAYQENASIDIVSLLEIAVKAADASVQHTPELLQVLKEAGVVDAGGKGLYLILDGMLRHIDNLPLDIAPNIVQPLAALNLENASSHIEPGQDFEVVVDFLHSTPLDMVTFYHELDKIGTSIQVGEGDGMYRMHIHVPTEKRYEPIDYIMQLGTITRVSMENLLAQMQNQSDSCQDQTIQFAPIEPGQIAVVAVSPGIGISRLFASLGTAMIVEGGQTMNPSTQDIVHAFEDLPTDKVIILPNNKNIIMAARIAASLTVKKAAVIPSVSIPQGLAAILRLVPHGDFDAVVEEMTASIEEVVTGEITTATRNVEIDGVQVVEGQIIVLLNGKLIAASSSLDEACLVFLENAQADRYELITLIYGKNVTRDEAARIADLAKSQYPDLEFEVLEGCQPHYQFIVSIE
jgi:uncharacterized protein